MPIWLYNIVVTPVLLVRVVILVILVSIAWLGEKADNIASWVDWKMPTWKESVAFRERRLTNYYKRQAKRAEDKVMNPVRG